MPGAPAAEDGMVWSTMDARDEVPLWRKSSRSTSGACVEVAPQLGSILIRDSKDPQGPVLTFGRESFAAFISGVAAGEFDRDAFLG